MRWHGALSKKCCEEPCAVQRCHTAHSRAAHRCRTAHSPQIPHANVVVVSIARARKRGHMEHSQPVLSVSSHVLEAPLDALK